MAPSGGGTVHWTAPPRVIALPSGAITDRGSRAGPGSATGWRSFDIVLDSIWRIRSRVTPYDLADLVQRLGLAVAPDRKRILIRRRPRARLRVLQHLRGAAPAASVNATASDGAMASESSMRSPNSESPSSPSGVCSEIGSRPYFCTSTAPSRPVMSSSRASSSGVGSRPRSWQHLALDARQLVDDLDHVHGHADGACLIGHRAGDGLTDPPRGVGGELEALRPVELLDSSDEAQVAFLDQVQEEHAAAGVALGQRHHQSQVRLQQVVLGLLAVLSPPTCSSRLAA